MMKRALAAATLALLCASAAAAQQDPRCKVCVCVPSRAHSRRGRRRPRAAGAPRGTHSIDAPSSLRSPSHLPALWPPQLYKTFQPAVGSSTIQVPGAFKVGARAAPDGDGADEDAGEREVSRPVGEEVEYPAGDAAEAETVREG